MTRLVCIIGTDGSGKTTLADALVERLGNAGQSAQRVWLGSDNYLMAPVRALLKLVWSRRRGTGKTAGPKPGLASQRVDYAAEIARKNALAARHPIAVRVYLAFVWLDYWLQLRLKRFWLRNLAIVVADRYLFDVVVNLGLTLGWSPAQVVRYAQTRLARVALPDVRVFLRVEAEVSMARKDDVFDIDYLRMRLSYYDAIAQAFGFTVLDGTLPIAENADWLEAETVAAALRPYVLYVHANNVDVGGADKVLALMARHMRDHAQQSGGCRVAVALRLATPIVAIHSQAGVPVFLYPFERPQLTHGMSSLIRFLFRGPASLWFFWHLFGRERPDIVHVNDLYDFIPALAARLRGIPVVWHIRMIVERNHLRRAFAALIPRVSQVSISVSHAVRDHYFPAPPRHHRALVIHDLGNATLIADDRDPTVAAPRPADLPRGGRLVLMVGRIEPWKGQHVFVEAVDRLSESLRRSTVFAMAGGPVIGKEDYFNGVRNSAAKAGVVMLGDRTDVPALMRAAEISVHASVTPDPFPGVVIESLLAGAATLATASGGAVEMIEDGTHGRLCPPGDAAALALRLADLLADERPPRARFGAAARSRALELVDATVVDDAVRAVYASLVPQGKGRTA